VHLASSVFGDQNTKVAHASEITKSIDELAMSASDGVLILEDPHRLPRNLRRDLAFIEDLTRSRGTPAPEGQLREASSGVVVLPSTRPLMQDAPNDRYLAKKLRSQFITLQLDDAVSEGLCVAETEIREAAEAHGGAIGQRLLQTLAAQLSEEEGVETVSAELAQAASRFRNQVLGKATKADDDALLNTSSLIYASMRFATNPRGPKRNRNLRSRCRKTD